MKKFLKYTFIIIIIGALILCCTQSFWQSSASARNFSPPKFTGTYELEYDYNGETREYILYIPEDLPNDAPLVIGMHGYTSSPWVFKNNFGWDKLAEQHKFIMCYPQGTYEPFNDYSHWNARIPLSTVDDVGFISELSLHLANTYNLDTDRIFATGFSNGGYMAYTLACESPDVFRAVASVSGLMSEYTYKSYNPYNLSTQKWLMYYPSTPIPVCHIHGTNDLVVPIDGSEYLKEFVPGLSAQDTIEFWAGINECTQIENKQLTDNASATYYINPNNNNQVWYIEYSGWSHYWPSQNYHVNKQSEINAQEIIWDFFSLYK